MDSRATARTAEEAEALFAEFLAAREFDGAVDFEAWLQAHQQYEARLRDHYRDWLELQPLVERLVDDASSAGVLTRARDWIGLSGRVLGDFRILKPLGRGGMGWVLEAEQISLRRRVALKLLDESAFDSERQRERFQREAEAGGRLNHPNIVAVYGVGEVDGRRFIAQELVEGGRTLHDWIEEARRRPELDLAHDRWVARTFALVAGALQAAHEAGVIHRDVKPRNILLQPDGTPKVADFGLVKLASDHSLSRSGDLIGTYHYMSPEQASGDKLAVDARSDVFSLGVALYEALTLSRPFTGDTPHQILRKIADHEVPDPRALRSRVPRDLALICGKAIEKEPRRRYASMRELAEDLQRFLRDEPVSVRAPGLLQRAQRWSTRHPTLSATAVTVVLAFSALAMALRSSVRARDEVASRNLQILRLADARKLADLRARADVAWPALPERLPEFRGWLSDAQDVLARLPAHERDLESLRRVADSQEDVAWFADRLGELIAELEALGAAGGLRTEIRRRHDFAASIGELSLHGDLVRCLWDEAVASIADPLRSPRYGGLRITPQVGLVPLGQDADGGLWEFAHLASGEVPACAAEGKLVLTAETGTVLVLLPSASAWVGNQPFDPHGHNYDPNSKPGEYPPREVRLDAFFISKYETTQAQWQRATGSNPSYFPVGYTSRTGEVSSLHPVENVSWDECVEVLRRLDLELPSEDQWEYAARAGSNSIWWTGDECLTLLGAANVYDGGDELKNGTYHPELTPCIGLADGFPLHAPIGRLRPNAFGLHDTAGNVWEWCAPEHSEIAPTEVSMWTGLDEVRLRALRGGSFANHEVVARSAVRDMNTSDYRRSICGLRPARALRK